ncbi:MAG: DegT/DnrJ/EryC1/StrS family aminotransferase [Candidatus Latescibacteria bacterium]|nr:DegT/DnrJ/EryC1/StrS family aminotransferase [Candidatus Latescibacterota bacterium]
MSERLAIDGGPKAVSKLGPHSGKLHIEELEGLLDLWEYPAGVKEEIVEVIRRNAEGIKVGNVYRYYNEASKVLEAEQAMAKYIGTDYCLAVNSGTSALIASLRAMGIGSGDEVIVPGYTFFASAAVIGTCNAVPVIADVDDTLTLDPKGLEAMITPRTKAIIVVHMSGLPAQMDEIMTIAGRHDIPVIEDVAQANGGSYKGRMLGSIGAVGCFSFGASKILASGEGGFITTNDEWLYTRAQSWHDCAACWRPNRYEAERREGELFCGENYRMSEFQGAVALAQIQKATLMMSGYRAAKRRITQGLALPDHVTLQRVSDPEGDTGTCIFMYLPDADSAKWAIEALRAEGVRAGGVYDNQVRDWHIYPHWEHILDRKSVASDGLPWSGTKPEYLPQYARDMCPQCLDYLTRAVRIPTWYDYSEDICDAIATGINKVFSAQADMMA